VKLLAFHRVLVVFAIALCGWMVWFEAGEWRREQSSFAFVLALLFVAMAALLTWYLLNLKRWVRIEPPEPPPHV
jgi:hypothetical protein